LSDVIDRPAAEPVCEASHRPILVNFVISKDLSSKIFYDIFKRYLSYDPSRLVVFISERPVDGFDVYHYHRPHLETELRAPAVVTVHHDPRDVDPWLDPKKFWSVYRQTAAIICLNSLQVEDLAKEGLVNSIVIPHGYDRKIFSKRRKTFDGSRKVNIGIVSKRYDRRFKGDAYIFEAAERLSPERVRYTLVGAGRTLDAARLRGLGFEVDVFEYLPYRLYGALYKSMDFLMMVSTYEGGPANLPEALASSTPVLCTNCGMVPDIIEHGRNGWVLTGDIRSDAAILEQICENHEGIADQLFVGAHEIESVVSWEEVIEQHIELYFDIIGQRSENMTSFSRRSPSSSSIHF
jgi:glycosyltransferase involved in cell wall biosynthesis